MSEYSTVAAYFPSDASAEAAMSALRAAGFRESQIGVAAASGPTVGATDNSNAYSAGQRAGKCLGESEELLFRQFRGAVRRRVVTRVIKRQRDRPRLCRSRGSAWFFNGPFRSRASHALFWEPVR